MGRQVQGDVNLQFVDGDALQGWHQNAKRRAARAAGRAPELRELCKVMKGARIPDLQMEEPRSVSL